MKRVISSTDTDPYAKSVELICEVMETLKNILERHKEMNESFVSTEDDMRHRVMAFDDLYESVESLVASLGKRLELKDGGCAINAHSFTLRNEENPS